MTAANQKSSKNKNGAGSRGTAPGIATISHNPGGGCLVDASPNNTTVGLSEVAAGVAASADGASSAAKPIEVQVDVKKPLKKKARFEDDPPGGHAAAGENEALLPESQSGGKNLRFNRNRVR